MDVAFIRRKEIRHSVSSKKDPRFKRTGIFFYIEKRHAGPRSGTSRMRSPDQVWDDDSFKTINDQL